MKGLLREKDKMAAGYICLNNPRYLEKDGKFYSGLFIIDYPRETEDLILSSLIKFNKDIRISMFFEKQDFYNTIKKLTYYIGNIGVNIKDGNENREDIDLISFSYNDAKYIRKQMQINNEELYYIYLYIEVQGNDILEMENNVREIENLCIVKGLDVKQSFFRQEELFKINLPLMYQEKILKEISRRNILTEGLKSTYPFITSRMIDNNGILVGKAIDDNQLIILDKFNKQKYKNSNIAIFGTSGAGKSFFTKLMIFRNYMLNMDQLVIDPEREYVDICRNLNGDYIRFGPNSNNYINIFDIDEQYVEENDNFFEGVIDKVKSFLLLILGNNFENEISQIEELIVETYTKKGINENKNSLYKYENNIKVFKRKNEMPILEDLYEIVCNNKKYSFMKERLFPYIKGSMKFFNNYTNIDISNKLIVADIFDLGEENLIYGMFLLTNVFWDKIQKDRSRLKSIYIDEIWRLIGMGSNKYVAMFVYKIFKTIRKYSGSAIAITQDISDLFLLEDGKYGKCIINNTSFKYIFLLEEENIRILDKNLNIGEYEKNAIKNLKRGETLSFIENNRLLLEIISSDYEKGMIEE